MTTIQVEKSDLNQAINACDVSGNWHLLEDGSIKWVATQQSAPDGSICAIPVYDPDGSGTLYDACSKRCKEMGIELDDDSPVGYLSDNYPDEYQAIVAFLQEDAIDKLKEKLEDVTVWVNEYTEETRSYVLEIVETEK